MTVDIDILLPARPARPEGGTAFIGGLADALRRMGHVVALQPGGAPEPGRMTVIDGMALPALPLDALSDCAGLVHHPAALAPRHDHGSRDAERERLLLLRRVVATSAPMGERLVAEFGVAPDRVRVVEPGMPDVARSSGSAAGQACAILSIGALVPRKGHANLLRALSRLSDLSWTLTIVGDMVRDPACAAALQAQADAMEGRVLFAGTLDAEALDVAWQAADLFALATEWEGYAAAVAEALRRGLPVAVAAGGEAARLVTPENGVACPPGDVDQLSKALRRLIFDRDLRLAVAQAAWVSGQALPSWSAQAAAFLEAIA